MENKYRIWTRKGIMSDWLAYDLILLFKGSSVVFFESLVIKPFVDKDLAHIKENETGLPLSTGGVIGYDHVKTQYFFYVDDIITPLQEYGVRQLLQREHHQRIHAYVEAGKGDVNSYLAKHA